MHFCKVQQTRERGAKQHYLSEQQKCKGTHEDHHDERCGEVARPRRQPADEVVVRSGHGVPGGVVKEGGGNELSIQFNPIRLIGARTD